MEIVKIKGDAPEKLFEDIAALDEVCVGGDGWSAKSFAEEAANVNGILLCALDGGTAAGLICGYFAADQADIVSVGVHPDYRRKGIAVKLMDAFEAALPNDTESIFLEVRETNQPAIQMYRKCGFECVGIRRDFYSAPTENALIMQKKIDRR